MDEDGNAVATWVHYDANERRFSIWARHYVAGFGWDFAEEVDPDSGTRYWLDVVMGPGGTATAIWKRNPSGDFGSIRASTYDPVAGWEAPTQLSLPGLVGAADSPAVTANPHLGVFATWEEPVVSGRQIYVARHSEGGWGPATPIVEATDDSPSSPSFVEGSGDDLGVVWEFSTTGEYGWSRYE
jgi:hypothetical protein